MGLLTNLANLEEEVKTHPIPLSELIKKRLKKNKIPFGCNDNISEWLGENELETLEMELQGVVQMMLEHLVIDTENDHNTMETARRVAKMFIQEIFVGRYSPMPRITAFPNKGYQGLYITGPISIRSTCAHHMLPITGNCWVGVVPDNEVIGLSKFNRIIQHIASRPQIQEELTTQIAEALKEFAKTSNVAVVLKAEHHCMTQRGVKEAHSDMTTAVMLGMFEDDSSLKAEFYELLKAKR